MNVKLIGGPSPHNTKLYDQNGQPLEDRLAIERVELVIEPDVLPTIKLTLCMVEAEFEGRAVVQTRHPSGDYAEVAEIVFKDGTRQRFD
jgi:hypothetical protein